MTLYGRAVSALRLFEDDMACEVGRWLACDEDCIGHLREYGVAKDVHGRVHCRAVYCLRLAGFSRRLDVLAQTERDGELRRLTRLLIASFQDLMREARQRGLQVG